VEKVPLAILSLFLPVGCSDVSDPLLGRVSGNIMSAGYKKMFARLTT
jgi:hypothetical protein